MANDYRFIGSAPKDKPSTRKVMLATPVSQSPACAYAISLAATMHTLASFGVEAHVYLHQGNCHVDDARNTMIRDFLDTDCTDLFFLDADLGWRPQSVMRLLNVPGDIVAGVYCHRGEGETYPFHPGEGIREANEHGLYEMHKAPTGFMRIRREVVEALYNAELAKGRKFWWGVEDRGSDRKPLARIVERGFLSELGLKGLGGSNSDYHSGDLVLCLKARLLGFKVWVDIENWFEHVGEKAYSGHLGNHLRKQQGVDHSAFAAAVEAVKVGDISNEVFQRINALSPNPRSALPGLGLAECYAMAKDAGGHILECGSGLSTIVMGLALKGTEHTVYALEHDLFWFKVTSRWMARYGVDNATLIYAPLMPFDTGDWYGVGEDELPESFDAVLIDGPTRVEAKRDGVFAHLGERIKNASAWIVDDCGDPLQMAMIDEHAQDRDIRWVTGLTGDGVPHKMAVARSRAAELIAAE